MEHPSAGAGSRCVLRIGGLAAHVLEGLSVSFSLHQPVVLKRWAATAGLWAGLMPLHPALIAQAPPPVSAAWYNPAVKQSIQWVLNQRLPNPFLVNSYHRPGTPLGTVHEGLSAFH